MSPGAERDTRHALRSARATCTSLSLALQSPTLPEDVRRVLDATRAAELLVVESLRGLLFKGRTTAPASERKPRGHFHPSQDEVTP